MAIKKEWRCLAHGSFEGGEGVCPHGCTTVVREFLTAPGAKSERTKISDRALSRLASRYQLGDMSNRNGSVGNSRGAPPGMAPIWAELPKGNNYEVGKGEVTRDGSQGGATAALSSTRMSGSVAAEIAKMVGHDVPVEPTFMDISKNLPRVRPLVRAESGTSSDLDKAIKVAS
jgi:hypothetical protein